MMYGTGATIYGTRNLTDWDRGRRIRLEVMAEGIEECAINDLVAPSSGRVLLHSGMGDIGGFAHTNLNRAMPMIVNPKIDGVNSIDYAVNRSSYVVRLGGDEVWTADGGMKRTLLGISSDYGRTWKPAVNAVPGTTGGWTGIVAVSVDARIIVQSGEEIFPHWTSNEGRTWAACTGLPLGVRVISDRVNANKFYAFGRTPNGNAGTWISTDGARTFAVANDNVFRGDIGSQNQKNFKAVNGLEDHLWLAGGEQGLFHSMDGGRTWARIEGFNCQTGCDCERRETRHNQIPIIGLGRAAPGADYQALYTNAKLNGQWGIWRSDDKGQTWVRINDDTQQFGAANTAITGCPRVYGRVFLGANGRGILWRDLE